jgi:hypothetical protein
MMESIKDKLGMVAGLAGGSELERDLALQLLREVYAELKFGASPAAAETVDEPAMEGEDCGAPEQEDIETKEPAVEAKETEPEEIEPEEIEPKEIEPEEPADAVGEAPQIPIIPRPVAPNVIRSLYGTETEIEPETEPIPEPQPETEHETEELQPKPEPVSVPDEKPRTTLGDAMTARHRTLGETLRKGEPDLSAHTAAAERSGLKRSIGLNDRFLVIRDMFDGDAAAFDAAIDRLDGFTDLDEAVIWLRGNFDRSADNKGMQLLVTLIERKLGR